MKTLLGFSRERIRFALDWLGDKYLHIDTVTVHSEATNKASRFGDAYGYGTPLYLNLCRFLAVVRIGPQDVFCDIGCGYGRALCLVARKRVKRCIGIELSPEFAAKARANARTVRHRIAPVEVRIGDASEADYQEGTVFFMVNPFGPNTLRSVLGRIEQSLAANPRHARFIYVHPKHAEVFDATSWLKPCRTYRVPFGRSIAKYWETV